MSSPCRWRARSFSLHSLAPSRPSILWQETPNLSAFLVSQARTFCTPPQVALTRLKSAKTRLKSAFHKYAFWSGNPFDLSWIDCCCCRHFALHHFDSILDWICFGGELDDGGVVEDVRGAAAGVNIAVVPRGARACTPFRLLGVQDKLGGTLLGPGYRAAFVSGVPDRWPGTRVPVDGTEADSATERPA